MLAALAAGVAAAAPDGWGLPQWLTATWSTHFHLFVVGWITQIIFGVALWMFPSWSRELPRGPVWLGWSCFGALNAGLVLRGVAEFAVAAGMTSRGWAWAQTVSAVLLFAAAVAFAVAIWPRVGPRRRRKKKRG